MKINEIIAAKPTADERALWAMRDDEALEPGTFFVAKNQKVAFLANIKARLHEMGYNSKHIDILWFSRRMASIFPDATIRFVVRNVKSVLFKDTEEAIMLPTACKALVKNAFQDVFGVEVHVERDPRVTEYTNLCRYLDFKATLK